MASKIASDMITNLANLLPTGTFLSFQALVPLFSNNGNCGNVEKIMTAILIFVFVLLCFVLQFVDSVTTESGKVYYGIVTSHGLYNPRFRFSNIPGDLLKGDEFFTGGQASDGDEIDDYKLHYSDFIYGILSVVAFLTLSCLTPPVTACYYPGIPNTVVKTVPILVAIIVGAFFAFGPSGRHGVGFALSSTGFGFVPDQKQDGNSGSQSGEAADKSSKSPKVEMTSLKAPQEKPKGAANV